MTKKLIFSTRDPRGVEVSCTHGRWNNHIITGHTIMKDNLQAVIETIESPERICQSSQYPERDVYFGRTSSATYNDELYTKVIVHIDIETQTGSVVTAFPQYGMTGGVDEEGGEKYTNPKLRP